MPNIKLIIGKNSKIVRSVRENLIDFDFISHEEIGETDLNKYKFIFLFSWSHKSKQDNIDLISSIPFEKMVFISTTAVYSFLIRQQWASYPCNKKICEEVVLNNGGSILRIGVWGEEAERKIYGLYQKTSPEDLITALNEWGIKESKIRNVYRVNLGNIRKDKESIAKLFRKISLYLPNNIIFQLPFIVLGRAIGYANYGYSGDAISCCVDKLLIGCGVFGGYYYSFNEKEVDSIVFNDEDDLIMSQRGFKNTSVGSSRFGLASKWHGVFMEKIEGKLIKRIIFKKIPARPPRYKTIKAKIEGIEVDGNILRCITSIPGTDVHTNYQIESDFPRIRYEIVATSIILASGPLQNAKILNSIEPINISFDDHELACIGEVDEKDVLGICLNRMGPFVAYSESRILTVNGREFLMDFRPYVKAKITENQKFYMDGAYSIIKKLVLNFNFTRINEAVFNRIGYALKTKKYQLYVQVLANNCITFESGVFERTRLEPNDWQEIQNSISSRMPSFRKYESIKSIDALHMWSSGSLDSYEIISSLISQGTLIIFGSPDSDMKLDSTHHSVNFRNALLKKHCGLLND